MTRAVPAGQAGFSLAEAIVTLAIVAAMTATLLETQLADSRARRLLRERREATLVARSVLDRVAADEAGDAGNSGRFAWRIERQDYGTRDPFDRHPLEQVTVIVAAEDGPVARLATVRMRP